MRSSRISSGGSPGRRTGHSSRRGTPSRSHERGPVGFVEVGRVVFGQYPRRSILGLSLFVGQAFLYNAVFFTFALVLTTFYKVNAASVGLYLLAFAWGISPGRSYSAACSTPLADAP